MKPANDSFFSLTAVDASSQGSVKHFRGQLYLSFCMHVAVTVNDRDGRVWQSSQPDIKAKFALSKPRPFIAVASL